MKTKTILIIAAVLATAATCYAYSAPTTTGFAYDIYNVVVNKILKGPLGYLAGIVTIVFSSAMIIIQGTVHNFWFPLAGAVLGGVILNADKLMISKALKAYSASM